VITNQHEWHAATFPVLTVPQQWKATANAVVYPATASPLATVQGTRLPIGATAPEGTGAPAAGFRATGVDVQATVRRMAVIDRSRLTSVPGVPPRGAPV
jgi:hypothetical protein